MSKVSSELIREILSKRVLENKAADLSVGVANDSNQVLVDSAVASVTSEVNSNGATVLMGEQLSPLTKALDKRIPISYVTVKTGMTVNLGNYNNAKVDVSISVPVGFEITDEYRKKINEAHDFAKEFVEEKTREQVKRLVEYARSQRIGG